MITVKSTSSYAEETGKAVYESLRTAGTNPALVYDNILHKITSNTRAGFVPAVNED